MSGTGSVLCDVRLYERMVRENRTTHARDLQLSADRGADRLGGDAGASSEFRARDQLRLRSRGSHGEDVALP